MASWLRDELQPWSKPQNSSKSSLWSMDEGHGWWSITHTCSLKVILEQSILSPPPTKSYVRDKTPQLQATPTCAIRSPQTKPIETFRTILLNIDCQSTKNTQIRYLLWFSYQWVNQTISFVIRFWPKVTFMGKEATNCTYMSIDNHMEKNHIF